jgi:hypothetical protein
VNASQPPRHGRRAPRRRRLLRFWIGAAALVVAFGAGLALGQSLDDNPQTGRSQTLVRTLKPLAVPPVPETVTVTTRR